MDGSQDEALAMEARHGIARTLVLNGPHLWRVYPEYRTLTTQ